jgi:hypothetical protein
VTGNPLVPYLIRHGLAGTFAGWMTAGLLLTWDVAGVGRLVLASDLFPVPLLMLFAFFGLTFASVSMGAAIMGLGWAGPEGTAGTPSAAPPDRQSAPAPPPAPQPPAARQ